MSLFAHSKLVVLALVLMTALQPVTVRACWCVCEPSAETASAKSFSPPAKTCGTKCCHSKRQPASQTQQTRAAGASQRSSTHPCNCPEQCDCKLRHDVLSVTVERLSDDQPTVELQPTADLMSAVLAATDAGILGGAEFDYSLACTGAPSCALLCRYTI